MKTTSPLPKKVEFGDYQTPIGLARGVVERVAGLGISPAAIVEPSCGIGNLLFAAADRFSEHQCALGIEVQSHYVEAVAERLARRADADRVRVLHADFFAHDWGATLEGLPGPLLVIGNPPWVTNAELAGGCSGNLPAKTNFRGLAGLDAMTGKSNFDISEAMLQKLVRLLARREAVLAVLCKTTVARKILVHIWSADIPIRDAGIVRIDSAAEFGAAVDACLFHCRFGARRTEHAAQVFASLESETPLGRIGYRDGRLLADADLYARWAHLEGPESQKWRSGIKHDCAEVCELVGTPGAWRNARGERVDIEPDCLFPMLKASDLDKGRVAEPRRWMLVTQDRIRDDPAALAVRAPRTWAYLQANLARFERRASTIYKGRPQFSMFGIGDYSFSLWKVGIAGLSKRLGFRVIGPHAGRPVVLDDTCYFLSCASRTEAEFVAELLDSRAAREFYEAIAFWDAKRPITVELLRRLNLDNLAHALGRSADWKRLRSHPPKQNQRQTTASLWTE